jgi:hypothetical protein
MTVSDGGVCLGATWDGYARCVKRAIRRVLVAVGMAVVAVRAKTAQQAYLEEVSAGARPIEAVGTAVAAFIGIAPGGRGSDSEVAGATQTSPSSDSGTGSG